MSASFCFDTARSLMVSSQAYPDNLFNSFDLCAETFSSIFQNVKPCQYLNPSCLPIHCNNNKQILLHLNIRSLQKTIMIYMLFCLIYLVNPILSLLVLVKLKRETPQFYFITRIHFSTLKLCRLSNAARVGVYITNLLQFNEITFKARFPSCESLWINLKFSTNESSRVIGIVYRYLSTSSSITVYIVIPVRVSQIFVFK